MTYNEFKTQIQSEFNDFPIAYAFSDKQLKEGLEELGVKDTSEVSGVGSGGFIRKSDKQSFIDLCTKHSDRTEEFLSKDENLKSALVYELGNHEYCITGNPQEAFEALGIDETKRTKIILKLAIKQYWEENDY
jgi:hypothetical protein